MEEKNLITNRLSRRDLLFQIGGVGLLGFLGRRQMLFWPPETHQSQGSTQPLAGRERALSQEDDDFLQEMEKRNFQYFWEQAKSANWFDPRPMQCLEK